MLAATFCIGFAAAANPVFPLRWQAHEASLIHQGPLKEKTAGTSYFDAFAGKNVFIKVSSLGTAAP
jgi:hypothetical protein